MKTTRIILTSFAITAGFLKGAPTVAEPAPANVSIVYTADLDLSSPAGQRTLDHRLVQAAYEVCGTPSDVDLKGKNDARACRADVLAKARATSVELANRSAPIRIAAGR